MVHAQHHQHGHPVEKEHQNILEDGRKVAASAERGQVRRFEQQADQSPEDQNLSGRCRQPCPIPLRRRCRRRAKVEREPNRAHRQARGPEFLQPPCGAGTEHWIGVQRLDRCPRFHLWWKTQNPLTQGRNALEARMRYPIDFANENLVCGKIRAHLEKTVAY